MTETTTNSPLMSTRLGGLQVFQFRPLVGHAALVHAVTGRPHNLAAHVGAGSDAAVENRRILCSALDVDFRRLTLTRQVHGAKCHVIDATTAGGGREGWGGAECVGDALLTDAPGVSLLVLSADCPLILAFDPRRPAVGVAHASWRGTVAGVTEQLVVSMQERFGCHPAAMNAAIAPSAGSCCYEVQHDVVEAARRAGIDFEGHFVTREDRTYFDLWSANVAQLMTAGVSRSSITVARICTICDARFYSHRREGTEAGRFGLLAAIRG